MLIESNFYLRHTHTIVTAFLFLWHEIRADWQNFSQITKQRKPNEQLNEFESLQVIKFVSCGPLCIGVCVCVRVSITIPIGILRGSHV